MSERKLTIEVMVDDESEESKWLWEPQAWATPTHGVRIKSIGNDWISEITYSAIRNVNNYLVRKVFRDENGNEE